MNDFEEVKYGARRLANAWHRESGARFRHVLEAMFPGAHAELERLFNSWRGHFEYDTYLMCLSEHLGGKEDLYGRLSMWRAYGGSTGVALVLNTDAFMNDTPGLNIYSSPVAYMDDAEFSTAFSKVIEAMEREADFLRDQGKDRVLTVAMNMLRFAMLCTKHPAFVEEREWRLVYTPSFERADHLVPDVVTIRGLPQPIYKIPLLSIPDKGLVGADLPDLLGKLIIGPTQYPDAIYDAFYNLLRDRGIANPERRIVVSRIPLR